MIQSLFVSLGIEQSGSGVRRRRRQRANKQQITVKKHKTCRASLSDGNGGALSRDLIRDNASAALV